MKAYEQKYIMAKKVLIFSLIHAFAIIVLYYFGINTIYKLGSAFFVIITPIYFLIIQYIFTKHLQISSQVLINILGSCFFLIYILLEKDIFDFKSFTIQKKNNDFGLEYFKTMFISMPIFFNCILFFILGVKYVTRIFISSKKVR